MRTNSSLFGLGAVLATSTLVTAQIVVPPHCEFADGGGNAAQRVFGSDTFKYQQVVEARALSQDLVTPVVINGIGYRPDSGTSSGAPAGGTFTNVVIKVSHTSIDHISIGQDYATNVGGVMQTTVYDSVGDGPIVVPPFDAGANPGAVAPFFDIEFRDGSGSPVPWVYDPMQGNLLIEIVNTVDPGNDPLTMDGQQPGGSYSSLGSTSGTPSCPDPLARYRLNVSGSSTLGTPGGNRAGIAPGEGFTLLCEGAPCYAQNGRNLPVAFLLQVTFRGQPFANEVDMGFLGAPGNIYHLDPLPILSVSAATTFVPPMFFGGPRATQTLPISSDPIWRDARITAQAATLDAPANALGVVFSNKQEIFVGLPGGQAGHTTGQVSSTDPNATSGSVQGDFTSARSYGAVLKIY